MFGYEIGRAMDTFWEPIIIENDELKKIRLLVHRLRQEIVNCACDIVHARSHGKLNKRSERKLFDELHEKRIHLDDAERSLSVAETYNYELMEARRLAQSETEDKKVKEQLRREESLREAKYNSEVELLKTILTELWTIRKKLE